MATTARGRSTLKWIATACVAVWIIAVLREGYLYQYLLLAVSLGWLASLEWQQWSDKNSEGEWEPAEGADPRRNAGDEERQEHEDVPKSVPNPEIVAALETLGIDGTHVPWSTVVARYRELAKQCHPDRYSGLDLPPEMIRTAEEQFTRITAAYETLQRYRRPL